MIVQRQSQRLCRHRHCSCCYSKHSNVIHHFLILWLVILLRRVLLWPEVTVWCMGGYLGSFADGVCDRSHCGDFCWIHHSSSLFALAYPTTTKLGRRRTSYNLAPTLFTLRLSQSHQQRQQYHETNIFTWGTCCWSILPWSSASSSESTTTSFQPKQQRNTSISRRNNAGQDTKKTAKATSTRQRNTQDNKPMAEHIECELIEALDLIRSLLKKDSVSSTAAFAPSRSPDPISNHAKILQPTTKITAAPTATSIPGATTTLNVIAEGSGDTIVIRFPSIRDCNMAIAELGDDGDLLRALRLFKKMRQAATLVATTLGTGSSKIRNVRLSISAVPAPTLVTYSILMSRAVKVHNKPRVALRIWNLMAQQPHYDYRSIDIKAANIRMNCFAKLADVSRAQQLMEQMETGCGPDVPRLAPNLVTYNTLLHACQLAGDLDTALQVAAKIRYPDARTYTSLIATVARQRSAIAGRNDPSLAFSLLREMKRRGIRPNGMTYSALIDVCGRCRRSDLALQGLRIMLHQKNIEATTLNGTKATMAPNLSTSTLSGTLGVAATDTTPIKTLLPNEVGAWTAAINACGKSGRLSAAMRLFYAMPSFGVLPNTITCGSLTDSLLREGRVTETLSVLQFMKEHGLSPSEVMYTSLMTRAETLVQVEKNKNRNNSNSSLNRLRMESSPKRWESHAVDDTAQAIEIYTALIQSLTGQAGTSSTADAAGKILSSSSSLSSSSTRISRKRMVRADSSRSTPSPSSASGVPSASTASPCANTLLVKVFLVFQQMKAAGAKPDLACFNALLRACARAGDYEHAQDVIRQMQDADLDPNDTSWRQLLQAAMNRTDLAVLAWKQGIQYNSHRSTTANFSGAGSSGNSALRDVPLRLRQWHPSAASLGALISVYLTEAKTSDWVERKKIYEIVASIFDDVLYGRNDRSMGWDRIDVMEVLDSNRTMVQFLQAMTALIQMENDTRKLASLLSMMKAILDLESLRSTSSVWSSRMAREAIKKTEERVREL